MITVFLVSIALRADAEEIVKRTTDPPKGQLPEYRFAIRDVVQALRT